MGVATAEKRTAKARTQAHPANHAQQSPELLAATRESSIEESIRNLVAVRAAQLNGCTFCRICTSSRPRCMVSATVPVPFCRLA